MINIVNDKRIRIITGHYGSGKTEFSINYAIKLAVMGKKVVIADLDIVNMYFRSREKADMLEALGIKLIGNAIDIPAIEVPSISPEVEAVLNDETYEVILDIGGDPSGAKVLGRYVNYFKENEYDMFFVLNANRPETQTTEKTLEYMKKIQDVARANITGIVNNTHLLKSTTIEDVFKGQQLAMEVSKISNVKIKYISALKEITKNLPEYMDGNIFPLKLFMREDWML